MPSVQQTSTPIAETSRTMSSTRSNCTSSRTSRHAAPMQTRLTPFRSAFRAMSTTSALSISACGSTPVCQCADCEQ